MSDKKNKQLNRYSMIGGKARKATRRTEALARKAKFDKLSLKQKLTSLPINGADRQRARYEALLDRQMEAQKETDKQKRKKERTQQAAEQLAAEKRD